MDPASLTLDASFDILDHFLDIPEASSEAHITDVLCVPPISESTPALGVSPPLKSAVGVFPPAVDGKNAKALFSWALRTRLQYAIDKMAAAPRQMVEENPDALVPSPSVCRRNAKVDPR